MSIALIITEGFNGTVSDVVLRGLSVGDAIVPTLADFTISNISPAYAASNITLECQLSNITSRYEVSDDF